MSSREQNTPERQHLNPLDEISYNSISSARPITEEGIPEVVEFQTFATSHSHGDPIGHGYSGEAIPTVAGNSALARNVTGIERSHAPSVDTGPTCGCLTGSTSREEKQEHVALQIYETNAEKNLVQDEMPGDKVLEQEGHKVSISFVGNPGVGKSTLLNGLCQSIQFKSGVSIGSGLTTKLERHSVIPGLEFCDTPGLADVALIDTARKEVNKLLKESAHLKIVFVVTLESGRARPQDVMTINLVLDAIQDPTDNKFGVIVNKMHDNLRGKISQNPEREAILRAQILDKHRTCFWHYIPMQHEIDSHDDQMLLPPGLMEFIYSLPTTRAPGVAIREIDTFNVPKVLEETEKRITGVVGLENSKDMHERVMLVEQENVYLRERIDERRLLLRAANSMEPPTGGDCFESRRDGRHGRFNVVGCWRKIYDTIIRTVDHFRDGR